MITRNMDTTSLATTFPFTSSELTQNQGVLYGINEHNGSLVILDRFSMENANSVIFAKSGAGKSYLVKLEALRSLMFDTEVIIIDPENEYEKLCTAVGGQYIKFSFSANAKINPFDLSQVYEEGQNELGQKVLSLHSLFKIIMGQVTPQEEALLDRAIILTYKQKGITPDPGTQKKEPPLLEDLYKVLVGMEEAAAESLAARLEKYVKGSSRGVFDQQTNIDIKSTFTVFSIRELEDALRPVAMFMILDFIWTKVKKDLKRRLMIIDEAWYMMKYPDSASFVYSMAKRARKYYLGLTTITQDVEDFLGSDYGKAIVTNSSIQILMKQSTAAIDNLAKVFYLSEGEKHLLLSCGIGHGIIFAGANHVALNVVASPEEHNLITSSPEELLRQKAQAAIPPSIPPSQVVPPTPKPVMPTAQPAPQPKADRPIAETAPQSQTTVVKQATPTPATPKPTV
jgi:type IV secretory pathway VirB4 component